MFKIMLETKSDLPTVLTIAKFVSAIRGGSEDWQINIPEIKAIYNSVVAADLKLTELLKLDIIYSLTNLFYSNNEDLVVTNIDLLTSICSEIIDMPEDDIRNAIGNCRIIMILRSYPYLIEKSAVIPDQIAKLNMCENPTTLEYIIARLILNYYVQSNSWNYDQSATTYLIAMLTDVNDEMLFNMNIFLGGL